MNMTARIPLLLLLIATPVRAADFLRGPAGPTLVQDPLLRDLVKQALEKRPELAQARAQVAAEQERVPQGQTLPDPTLSVGMQNERLDSIQLGKTEMSWVSIVAAQTFPWVGKRGLRGDVASLQAETARADLQRLVLSVAAEVESAYVNLLLVRDQLGLLGKLETLWTQSEGLARARYEAGQGAQSDLLRAQLERNRLRQRRWALQAIEHQRLIALNRLRGRPLDEPVVTTRALADLPEPVLPEAQQAATAAEAKSPELHKALLQGQQADRRVDLARKERWPDLTVSVGVMPRGGGFPTMWQAGVAFNIPVWTVQKQAHAIGENQARGHAARDGAEAIRRLLQQRVSERVAALQSLLEANHLYRSGLLIQSEATVTSTLAQYQVGGVGFVSVLEALAGFVADQNGYLDSLAAAQQVAIEERAVSLDPPLTSISVAANATSLPSTIESPAALSRM
jgi:outer membrane protein, heavy metal efflux system